MGKLMIIAFGRLHFLFLTCSILLSSKFMTFIYFVGNVTFPGGSVYNDKFYLFDFGEQKVKWSSFTPTATNTIPTKPTGATSSKAVPDTTTISSNTEYPPQS